MFDRFGILLASPDIRRPLTPAQRVGQWSWTARAYESWRRRSLTLLSGTTFSSEQEWHLLFGELPLGGPRAYLDNATATGYLGRALARRLATTQTPFVVIANDLSLAMLRRASALARREGVADRMFFIHAASESLPIRTGSIDGILCGGTLNEFSDSDRVLREWSRVLSPGGAVSVMLQTLASGWRGWLQRLLGRIIGLTIESTQRALERFDAQFHRRRGSSFGPILFMSGGRRASSTDASPSQAA
jgi:ubiquinone/menaquinone biosynthesis C-methylase UbiE